MDENLLIYSNCSDKILCQMVSLGDLIAEETLVVRYHTLVRICARPYFLVGGDSEDLIQEGMVGLLHAVRAFQPDRYASFRTYAEICIKNRLFTVIKGANRGKHSPLNDSISLQGSHPSELHDQALPSAHPNIASPEDIIISKEAVEGLMEGVKASLSAFESKVFQRYLEGYSYVYIAEELCKSTKSVDNAVQRIKKKVAQYL